MSSGPFTSACSFLLLFLFLGLGSRICYGSGFGFNIHHRFSDPVKGILGFDGLPERGSVEYYAAMSHRDRLIRGRHLAASNNQTSPRTFFKGNKTAKINSLGFCGQNQTGSFLEGAAPNGLFGLGIGNISVPSTLARNGRASNSFALCFGRDGFGRISFGNNGSSDQSETPFNIRQSLQTYNISITQITVGKNFSKLEFSAIFDSGSSFTSLRGPAYTFISKSFNSQIQEKRHRSDPQMPFEYCYYLRENQTSYVIPDVNLTMKGGGRYSLNNPTVIVTTKGGELLYCLGLHKSKVNIDIIGQNFMTGYRIVFDRERMVLGWKDSNCECDSFIFFLVHISLLLVNCFSDSSETCCHQVTMIRPQTTYLLAHHNFRLSPLLFLSTRKPREEWETILKQLWQHHHLDLGGNSALCSILWGVQSCSYFNCTGC